MAVALPPRRTVRPLDAGALTAALYRQHAAELLRFAWHRLGRVEDAEDAVQTTFLSAHRVLQGGEDVREPRAWLFRILRNECLTRLALAKRRGTQEELGEWHADLGPTVDEQMSSHDAFDTAVALLATLPVQQREAMVLREWLGLSAIETAGVLEVTPQAVDALVYRARKALVGLDDVEPASTCAEVRGAFADGRVTASARAHLLTCRGCRGAARRLTAPEELAAAGAFLPLDALAARIGESVPGFIGAGAAAAVVGGGAAAAGTIAAGTAVKVVAAVAIGAVVAGGAVRGAPAVERAFAPAQPHRAAAATPAPNAPSASDGSSRIAGAAPARAAAAAPLHTAGAHVAAVPPDHPDAAPPSDALPTDDGQWIAADPPDDTPPVPAGAPEDSAAAATPEAEDGGDSAPAAGRQRQSGGAAHAGGGQRGGEDAPPAPGDVGAVANGDRGGRGDGAASDGRGKRGDGGAASEDGGGKRGDGGGASEDGGGKRGDGGVGADGGRKGGGRHAGGDAGSDGQRDD